MFVPVITVSVATGHQGYHPVHMSPANLACRAHGEVRQLLILTNYSRTPHNPYPLVDSPRYGL